MAKLKPAVHEGDRGTGNKNANIILVEFGDYQCPHCGHAYPLLTHIAALNLSNVKKRIKLVKSDLFW